MKQIERMKREVLESYPRLSRESSFAFACYPGISCFNDCCRDVNIYLTPYDIFRLKTRLGMASREFLAKYTIRSSDRDFAYPVILLRMNDDATKTCSLLGEDGCGVYEARPWACRMYPLGMASPKAGSDFLTDQFYFVLEEEGCRGLGERRTQTVTEWLEHQGIPEYSEMGEYFKQLTLHEFFQKGGTLSPAKSEMFCLTCYDLDGFRDFVFKSTFLERFEVDEVTRQKIVDDDLALLKFGQVWLRLALFGERTLAIKSTAFRASKEEREDAATSVQTS